MELDNLDAEIAMLENAPLPGERPVELDPVTGTAVTKESKKEAAAKKKESTRPWLDELNELPELKEAAEPVQAQEPQPQVTPEPEPEPEPEDGKLVQHRFRAKDPFNDKVIRLMKEGFDATDAVEQAKKLLGQTEPPTSTQNQPDPLADLPPDVPRSLEALESTRAEVLRDIAETKKQMAELKAEAKKKRENLDYDEADQLDERVLSLADRLADNAGKLETLTTSRDKVQAAQLSQQQSAVTAFQANVAKVRAAHPEMDDPNSTFAQLLNDEYEVAKLEGEPWIGTANQPLILAKRVERLMKLRGGASTPAAAQVPAAMQQSINHEPQPARVAPARGNVPSNSGKQPSRWSEAIDGAMSTADLQEVEYALLR